MLKQLFDNLSKKSKKSVTYLIFLYIKRSELVLYSKLTKLIKSKLVKDKLKSLKAKKLKKPVLKIFKLVIIPIKEKLINTIKEINLSISI